MSNSIRCACPRCTIRGVMGPAVIVTLGVLFLLSEMRGGIFRFTNSWPAILVVAGFISLASSLAPMNGHIAPQPSQALPPGVPPASEGAPPPPPAYTGQGQ